MPKLLQSRLPLACTLAALLLVWLGDVLSQQGKAAAGKEPNPKLFETTLPFIDPNSLEFSITAALQDWIQKHATNPLAQRIDPFEYSDTSAVSTPTTNPAVLDDPPVTSTLIPPIVHAISIGSGKPMAVLDSSVVGEGDLLGTWRVERIDAEGVLVSGAYGQLRLRVERRPLAVLPPAMGLASEKLKSLNTNLPADNAARTP